MLARRTRVESCATVCALVFVSAGLAACGGGGGGGGSSSATTPPPTTQYTVAGSVSGLSGTGLVLQNNSGNDLAVSGNGTFTFSTAVNAGSSYSVSVKTQPSNPTQTCAVANGSGTANANVTNVAVTCTTPAAATVKIGGTVSGLSGSGLVLQDNGGDNLNVAASGTFTFATAIATGSAYAVTVATQPGSPNQSCKVTFGTGTASADVTNVSVICRTIGQFAYTANNTSKTISAYKIDPSTGALTPTSNSPVAIGAAPAAVSLTPNGKWAFSATDNGTKIYAFSIDRSSGALTPIAGSPFSTPFVSGHPYPDIAVDSQSKFLYLASLNDAEVAGFAIDQTTGALTPVPNSPFAAGAGASAIPAFSPDGKFLYVMNQNANTVSGYAIDPNTGSLTSINPSGFPTGAKPFWISFTPDGKFAYVANNGAASVSAYSVDAAGALTQLPGSPYIVEAAPADLTVDSSGTHLYVPSQNGAAAGAITVFAIGHTTGTLTQVGTPVAAGVKPIFVNIEATGRFAYAASSGGNDVYGYSIDPNTGGLTPLAGNPTPAGNATATSTLPGFITIDPSGKFAYTANSGSNDITAYSIDPSTGALNIVTRSVPAGVLPFFVSISPEAPGIRD